MKKFYSILTLLMCALFSFSASAQETDSKAVLFAKGDLYFATLQNDANTRQEVSVYQEEAAAGAYAQLDFNSTENIFNIKSMNESKTFFVYKNDVAVENAALGESNSFEAQTNLSDGDVVKVYSAQPYKTKMNIGFMQDLQEQGIADMQVEVIMDKVTPISVNELNKIFTVLEGTEFQIKAKAGYDIANVYYCNDDVVAVDGVYTITADREGEAMVIIDMKAVEGPTGVATVNIKGNFWNVAAQDVNIDDPRAAEVFSFQPTEAIDETVEVAVDGEKTIKLSAQNDNNEIYVALNGKKVASIQDGMFQAEITLKAGDVLDILNAEPATGVATVNIKGNFFNVTAQDVNIDDPRAAEVFSIQPTEAIDKTIEVAVDGEKTIKLSVNAEDNAVYVALNGKKVASTQDGMFQAEITLKAGDVLDILNAEPATGVATVNIKGNFFNVTAQDVNIDDPRAAEVFSIQPTEAIDKTIEVAVDGEKTIKLSVNAEDNAVYVALNGQKVASQQDGMFQAEITLKAGDVLDILNAEPATGVATVNIKGNFFNVTAQDVNIDDPRAAEVFSIQPTEAIDETIEVAVDGEKTIKLSVNAEDNAVYVALNGQKVASQQDGMFQAEITLKAGDVLDILNAEPATGVATVNIKGNFFNVTAQDVNIDDPRAAEVFSIQPTEAIDKTIEVAVDGEKTIKLSVNAEDNAVYVALNGQKVASQQDGMFQAEITLKAGDVLDILNAEPATGVATVNIKGNFFNVTAQDVNIDDPRAAEVFSIQPTEAIDKTIEVAVDGEKTIKLSVNAEDNKVYVALNGQKVASTQDGMFQAEITLRDGDILDITNAEPATGVAIVNINGNFWNVTAQDVNISDPRAAEVFSFQPEDGVVNETVEVALNETKTIRIIAQNDNNVIYVELNGEEVVSTQDYMFEAIITLQDGDVLNITNRAPISGSATINIYGEFYTFTAQDVKVFDPRAAEIFSVNGFVDQKIELPVYKNMLVRLVGQAEDNEIFVELNGQEIASTQTEMFEALVSLKDGDVLNIYNESPSANIATVNIKGKFWNVTAQDVNIDDPRAAEVFSFQPETGEIDRTVEIPVYGTKTIKLTVQNEENEVYVTLDGKQVASAMDGMFQAEITLKAGSVLNITDADPSGINIINAAAADGKIFNLQGIEVKNAVKGLYIVNGKKVLVK